MKEIHFYKDIYSLPNEKWVGGIFTTHNSTKNAINDGDVLIDTTAISALDFADLLSRGYRVFLHENKRCFECNEGVVAATDKEIRNGHDIRRIWIGGGFYNYFYG